MSMEKFLRVYHRGDYLALQGEKAHDFCVLRSGYVGIYRDNQQVATVHAAGEFIGEMAWLLGEPRTASARAETTNVEVYVIPTAGFDQAVKANPTLGLRLAQNLASRLKGATAQLSRERGAVPGQARLVGSDPATARLLNLLRAACLLRPEDDVTRVLLMHILRMTGPPNPNVAPPHEALLDVATAALPEGHTVDVQAILDRLRNEVLAPATEAASPPEVDASAGETPTEPSSPAGSDHDR